MNREGLVWVLTQLPEIYRLLGTGTATTRVQESVLTELERIAIKVKKACNDSRFWFDRVDDLDMILAKGDPSGAGAEFVVSVMCDYLGERVDELIRHAPDGAAKIAALDDRVRYLAFHAEPS